MNKFTKMFLVGMLLVLAAANLVNADPTVNNIMRIDTQNRLGGDTPGLKENVEFWSLRPTESGNDDIDLLDYGLDGSDFPGAFIWEIDSNGEDYTQVFDSTGALAIFTEENQIFDAYGVLQCTAHKEGDLIKLRQLSNGSVLLTASEFGYVFSGNLDALPDPNTAAWQRLIDEQLAYEFDDDRLYKVRNGRTEIAGRADVSLQEANPMRKLIISALFEGVCGVEAVDIIGENESVGDGRDFPDSFIWDVDSTEELRCQSQRCRDRQRRRIFRANCRLEGGYAIGWTCTIPEGGN
ncbi:hypothetical protein G3480_23960 [Thiorhodococcus mannitoliphagus]|uniref:Uncharacterized protein n=1 Tax=Thiorhodococcus mannitoliphagus TaxID=329406 RepID=A0A6P1E6Z2_9GAMM|nr:hypothetical protein [Thiorhodococcus mannitoliphagus]NEX23315.1 hypothetical protein [Thiorhodococcus mannitoliphagus]